LTLTIFGVFDGRQTSVVRGAPAALVPNHYTTS
jgi:hypothetical protein